MPGFIGCPGGRYEGEEDSLQAVVRETEEETGWIFKQESFTKINEGKNCDWYFVIKIDKPKNHTYTDIKTIGEIQDTNKLISKHRNNKEFVKQKDTLKSKYYLVSHLFIQASRNNNQASSFA